MVIEYEEYWSHSPWPMKGLSKSTSSTRKGGQWYSVIRRTLGLISVKARKWKDREEKNKNYNETKFVYYGTQWEGQEALSEGIFLGQLGGWESCSGVKKP